MILLVSMAFAGPVEEDVARARALVLEGDFAGALELLMISALDFFVG